MNEFIFKSTPEIDRILKEMIGNRIEKIVRCKDCKWGDKHHIVDGLFCYRLYDQYKREYPQMIIEVDANDFCSRGVKE